MSDAPTPEPEPFRMTPVGGGAPMDGPGRGGGASGEAGVPICLRCGARLDVHPLAEAGESRCPRCGLMYDPARPETYRVGSGMPRWQFNMAGLIVAVAVGAALFAILRNTPTMGSALFFGVPFAVGVILGFTTRARLWLTLMLGLIGVTSLAMVIVFMNLSGIFCGMTLGIVFLGPAMAGVVVGWLAKVSYAGMTRGRRRFVFLAIFVGLPFGVDGVERRWPMGEVIAEVSTSATFDAPVGRAWDSVRLYEEVEHEPPLLLRLALPLPVRAEGRRDTVGAEQRCVYRRGHLVKRITRRDPPRLLAFDVVEQDLHFEHDVELRDGSFILEPLGAGRTRVVLTTRYRRLLRPAWLWEPMERTIIHTLHGHVLEGMRRQAEGP